MSDEKNDGKEGGVQAWKKVYRDLSQDLSIMTAYCEDLLIENNKKDREIILLKKRIRELEREKYSEYLPVYRSY